MGDCRLFSVVEVSPGTLINTGEQQVSSGGSAVDTAVEGGLQTVFGGGSVSGTLINNGEQQVSSGGSAVDTTINGGLQTVFGGGSVSGTLINNGEQQVSSSGSAVGTTINGGLQTVSVAEMSQGLSLITGSSESPVVAVLLTQPLTMEGQ
ncbi:hypothetical protein ACLB1M_01465 [Escherichia coli]